MVTGSLPEWAEGRLEQDFDLRHFDDTEGVRLASLQGDDIVAVISRGALPIDADLIERLPCLQAIAKTGVGMDAIDVEAASRRNIPVLYTPAAQSRSVAEHALAMMLTLLKRLSFWQSELREGNWNRRYHDFSRDLTGHRVGIVGYGRIGRQLARLLSPFDCQVGVCDPYLDPSRFRQDGVHFLDLDELLECSEILSLHVPLNDETRGMMGASQLDLLPEGAILINTARGAVIESLDVVEAALCDGRLWGVGVDVFSVEPPDVEHGLFRHPQAVLTGHVAARSGATQTRIVETILKELLAILSGGRPRVANVVNPEVLLRC